MTLYVFNVCLSVIGVLLALLLLLLFQIRRKKTVPTPALLPLFRVLLWLANHAPGKLQAYALAALADLEIRTGKYLRCWPGRRPTLVDLDDSDDDLQLNVSTVNS